MLSEEAIYALKIVLIRNDEANSLLLAVKEAKI